MKNKELSKSGLEIMASFFFSFPDPLLIIDENGYIVYFNSALSTEWGLAVEQVRGRHWEEVMAGRLVVAERRYPVLLPQFLRDPQLAFCQSVVLTLNNDQPPRFYLMRSFKLWRYDRYGDVDGAAAIFLDIFSDRSLTKQLVLRRLANLTEQAETIYAFAEAIGARDQYTMGHSEKVAEYARLIAERMGLSEQEIDLVYLCGIVHDIGKIGVPENILNKPGPLSPEEFGTMRFHPVRGADILAHISWLNDVVPVIESHHERYDGRGYPRGLRGEEIPLLSRILAVADAFDAMTSDRSYRKALPLRKAISELKNNAGTQFDPLVVQVFLQIMGEYLGEEINLYLNFRGNGKINGSGE